MTKLDAVTFSKAVRLNGSNETHVESNQAELVADMDKRVVYLRPLLRDPNLIIPFENVISMRPSPATTAKRSKNSELTES